MWRGALRVGTDAISVTPNLERVPRGGWADYANTVRAPGYTLLGLGAEAAVGRARVFLDARNLTGRKAIGDISAVVAATPGSALYYPVERRAVYGGVRASF
jgi:iron complex outermembrane receptor protein